MSNEKVASRFDRCHLGLVFDRKFENIAEPIKIFSPLVRGNAGDALPCQPTECCLVPGTGRETRDAEIHAPHVLRSPQPGHAGKSAPGSLESTSVTIYDSNVVNAFAL